MTKLKSAKRQGSVEPSNVETLPSREEILTLATLDPDSILEQVQRWSTDRMRIAEAYGLAKKLASETKLAREMGEARRYRELRLELTASAEKVTEESLKRALKEDHEIAELMHLEIEAEYKAEVLKGAVDAVRGKKGNLELLLYSYAGAGDDSGITEDDMMEHSREIGRALLAKRRMARKGD